MDKNPHKDRTDPKIRKEFQIKSKQVKKVFAESKTNEELVRNMEKIGFTYYDDEES